MGVIAVEEEVMVGLLLRDVHLEWLKLEVTVHHEYLCKSEKWEAPANSEKSGVDTKQAVGEWLP